MDMATLGGIASLQSPTRFTCGKAQKEKQWRPQTSPQQRALDTHPIAVWHAMGIPAISLQQGPQATMG